MLRTLYHQQTISSNRRFSLKQNANEVVSLPYKHMLLKAQRPSKTKQRLTGDAGISKKMPERYLQADGREPGQPLEDDDPFIAP